MKRIEISDADYEALELLAKVHDVDMQLALNDLINIGCKMYKAHIDEYRARGELPWRRSPDLRE